MSVEQIEVIIPSDPAARKEIVRVLDEISNAFVRIAGERDFVKEEVAALAEKYDLPKKILNKMAKIHHNQNIEKVKFESDALVDAYCVITGKEVD